MSTSPFETTYAAERCIVRWAITLHHRVDAAAERTLTQLIQDNPIMIFSFEQTRVVGTRWLRLVQRLSIMADDMGKELAVVGLAPVLLEKADVVAIKSDLHLYDSIDSIGQVSVP